MPAISNINNVVLLTIHVVKSVDYLLAEVLITLVIFLTDPASGLYEFVSKLLSPAYINKYGNTKASLLQLNYYITHPLI